MLSGGSGGPPSVAGHVSVMSTSTWVSSNRHCLCRRRPSRFQTLARRAIRTGIVKDRPRSAPPRLGRARNQTAAQAPRLVPVPGGDCSTRLMQRSGIEVAFGDHETMDATDVGAAYVSEVALARGAARGSPPATARIPTTAATRTTEPAPSRAATGAAPVSGPDTSAAAGPAATPATTVDRTGPPSGSRILPVPPNPGRPSGPKLPPSGSPRPNVPARSPPYVPAAPRWPPAPAVAPLEPPPPAFQVGVPQAMPTSIARSNSGDRARRDRMEAGSPSGPGGVNRGSKLEVAKDDVCTAGEQAMRELGSELGGLLGRAADGLADHL